MYRDFGGCEYFYIGPCISEVGGGERAAFSAAYAAVLVVLWGHQLLMVVREDGFDGQRAGGALDWLSKICIGFSRRINRHSCCYSNGLEVHTLQIARFCGCLHQFHRSAAPPFKLKEFCANSVQFIRFVYGIRFCVPCWYSFNHRNSSWLLLSSFQTGFPSFLSRYRGHSTAKYPVISIFSETFILPNARTKFKSFPAP